MIEHLAEAERVWRGELPRDAKTATAKTSMAKTKRRKK